MLFPLKKILVNWVDGMKIGREHLEQMEDFFIDSIRDTSNLRLTNYNFGLLSPIYGEKVSSDFDIKELITNQIEIELRKCNAITAGGCRININPRDSSEYLKLDYKIDSDKDSTGKEIKAWDVILIIRPFDRVATGIPDPDESPLRHPNAGVNYGLTIKPVGQVNVDELGVNHLVIGRIARIGERLEIDRTYIPPCASMNSHPDLLRYYEQFGKYLNDIETSSHKILQKINDVNNNSVIAQNVRSICEDALRFIAGIYFDYRNKGRFYAPVDGLNTFSSLAHTCFVSIDFIPKKQREELLQYFYEWTDVTPGNFVDMLSEVLEMNYNHHDIRMMMEKTGRFLSVFTALWIKLCSLEYIGQHRENIVVAEQLPKQDTGSNRQEWTILD